MVGSSGTLMATVIGLHSLETYMGVKRGSNRLQGDGGEEKYWS